MGSHYFLHLVKLEVFGFIAVKGLEYVRHDFIRDADTLVCNTNDGLILNGIDKDLCTTVVRRELDRVGQQLLNGYAQLLFVEDNVDVVGRGKIADFDSLSFSALNEVEVVFWEELAAAFASAPSAGFALSTEMSLLS